MHLQNGLLARLHTLSVNRSDAWGRGREKMPHRMQVHSCGQVRQPRSRLAMQREANQGEANRAGTMRIARNAPC